ncbi:MAG: hypothetical protein AAF481_05280 [Acidobacteriota bacterium]
MTTPALAPLFSSPSPEISFSSGARSLPLAAIDWLGEHGFLQPEPRSPLAFWRELGRRSGQTARHAAGVDLVRRGFVRADWSPEVRRRRLLSSGPLGEALAVLERPEVRLRVGVGRPDGPAQIAELYIAGERATLGVLEGDVLQIGPAFTVEALIDSLADELATRGAPESFVLWPMLYRLTTALWSNGEGGAGEVLSPDVLRAQATSAEAADELSAQMLDAGVVEGDIASGLRLTQAYRRWLAPMWSGSVFELERREIERQPDEDATERSCLFVGPPGQRILCEELSSTEALGDPTMVWPEESLLMLSALSRQEVRGRLADLVAPGRAQRSACAVVH